MRRDEKATVCLRHFLVFQIQTSFRAFAGFDFARFYSAVTNADGGVIGITKVEACGRGGGVLNSLICGVEHLRMRTDDRERDPVKWC